MQKVFYAALLFLIVVVSSCKKGNNDPGTQPGSGGTEIAPSKTGSALDLMRDSVFLYAQEAYYWYDGLPTYAKFNPRSITGSSDLATLQKEVDQISQFKINTETGKPYEYYPAEPGSAKYSFIDEGGVSESLNGIKGDFGFAPLYADINDLRIRYVYPGSPADLAGIKRGYVITAINGRTALAYDADAGGSGANVNFVINAYANSNNITMTLKRFDGTTFNASLAVATYTLNPVLSEKVIDAGNGRKVGYIVFNSFTSPANANAKLNQAFSDFATQGVTDLVVDLRYNGGGYVATAEYLTNLIAPAAKAGSPMYYTYFNDKLANGKASLLKNQVRKDGATTYNYAQFDYSVNGNVVNFTKTGIPVTLNNLTKVFFIVTGSTASASELTINNIRAIKTLDVKLIGTTSYGKPVGFFDIDINKYQMYVPEFETKNADLKGGYYAGMTPGSTEYPGVRASDDVTKDFGDVNEGLLARALTYVKTGTFTSNSPAIQSLSNKTFSIDQASAAGLMLDNDKFKGMIFNKSNLKLKK
ncbi:S41 family peptidase [Mucilaginibacter sp.]|uniref:S41 family peptidase n=1 Tax=Mucilaginibacter sp. TaxID=1882438 RepID=UPI0035BBE947